MVKPICDLLLLRPHALKIAVKFSIIKDNYMYWKEVLHKLGSQQILII